MVKGNPTDPLPQPAWPPKILVFLKALFSEIQYSFQMCLICDLINTERQHISRTYSKLTFQIGKLFSSIKSVFLGGILEISAPFYIICFCSGIDKMCFQYSLLKILKFWHNILWLNISHWKVYFLFQLKIM